MKSHTGLWWEPQNNRRIPGTLTIEDDHSELKLIGEPLPLNNRGNMPPLPIAHGSTDDAALITLVDLRFAGGATRRPGLDYVLRLPTLVLIGDLFPDAESIRFEFVRVSFDHLIDWFGVWHFEGNLDSGFKHIPEIDLKARLFSANAVIEFDFTVNCHVDKDKASASHKSYLRITAPEPMPFEWFDNVICQLENFLSVCMAIPIRRREILTSRGLREVSIIEGRKPTQPIHKAPILNPPVVYPMIKSEFEKILNGWFEKDPSLKRLFGIFQNSVADTSNDSITRFLACVQVLEIYHRIKKGAKFSLVQRLRNLVTDLTMDEQTLLTNDNNQFMQIATNTRNFLMHFNSSGIIFDGLDLHWAMEVLRTLVVIWLYREMGFSPSDVVKWVGSHGEFTSTFDVNRLEIFRSGRAAVSAPSTVSSG